MKTKVAIIGGGISSSIGRAHFSALSIDNNYDIIAGCFSRSLNISKQTKKLFNLNCNIYDNYKILVSNEYLNVDYFILLSDTPSHFEVINYLLNKKVKIICEKPLFQKFNQVTKLINKYDFKKIKNFYLSYNYTFYPVIDYLIKFFSNDKMKKSIKFIKIEMYQDSFIRNSITNIQKWRRSDDFIPTICLDLGSHLVNLICTLKGKPTTVLSSFSSNDSKKNIIDHVDAIFKFKDNSSCNMSFSKSLLGHRNDLSINIYTNNKSYRWSHLNPENLEVSQFDGKIVKFDRSNKMLKLSKHYSSRYKPGHPHGFIESIANFYYFIKHQSKLMYRKNISIKQALIDVLILHNMSISNKKKKFITIDYKKIK